MPALISIEQHGERFYVKGKTFELKESIKKLGCKFDAVRRQWYASKKETAEQVISLAIKTDPNVEVVTPPLLPISHSEKIIIGRATYRTREYHVLVNTVKNDKHLIMLVFQDGSKVFWPADAAYVEDMVIYKEPKSINCLTAFLSCLNQAKGLLTESDQLPLKTVA
jgi:hypothetical protein